MKLETVFKALTPSEADIVRHPLVQAIVKAYEEDRPRKRRNE